MHAPALSQLSLLCSQVRTGNTRRLSPCMKRADAAGGSANVLQEVGIVIIGAGAAGLGCAARLAKAGVPFTILEASGRIGGRAHTTTWGGGEGVLELGATWLHGTEGHPLYEPALRAGLLGEPHLPTSEAVLADGTEEMPETAAEIDEAAAQMRRQLNEAPGEAALTAGGWLLPGGARASDGSLRAALRAAEELMEETTEFVEASDLADESVGSWVRRRFAAGAGLGGARPSSLEAAACEWRLRLETSISGAEPSRLSLRWFGEYAELNGGHKRTHGMQRLLERAAAALPPHALRFSHRVAAVAWAEAPPRPPPPAAAAAAAAARAGDGPAAAAAQAAGARVRLELADGAVVEARHVVCTASLGVLQEACRQQPEQDGGGGGAGSAALAFAPPLPSAKAAAIHRLGMGMVNKVFLSFERRWWRPRASFRLLWPAAATGGGAAGAQSGAGGAGAAGEAPVEELLRANGLPRWADCFFQFGPERAAGQAALVGWVAGEGAAALEALPEAEVERVVMGVLRLFIPQAPSPSALRLSRWASDPLIRGAYSYVPPGASGADYDAVAAPLRDACGVARVLFAGEACHRTFYSTLHGAWLSGEAQAELLLASREAETASR